MKTNSARSLLLVPLLMLPGLFAAFGQQPAASGQQWRQSEKPDSSGGPTLNRFTLGGKFVKFPQSEIAGRPSLAFDCVPDKRSGGTKGRFEAGSLVVGAALKIEYVEPEVIHGTSYFQRVAVRYRLDNGKEQKEDWPPGADKTSASFTKDNLKKMLRAHSVAITVDEDLAGEISMTFDVPDSTAVGEACGVAVHKK